MTSWVCGEVDVNDDDDDDDDDDDVMMMRVCVADIL